MNLVVLLEDNPDWIQLTNAITIKTNRNASAIRMLGDPMLNLQTAGLGPDDTLFLLGHGDPHEAGGYTAEQLAVRLYARRLPRDHRFIVLTSCEAGLGQPNQTYAANLQAYLRKAGYHRVQVAGAAGLAISGWGVDQVVDPADKDAYVRAEDRSIADNRGAIARAKVLAARIDRTSTSAEIVATAGEIAQLVEYFYDNLFIRANAYLMLPERPALRPVQPRMYRLNLAADANGLDARFRGSLNRGPQQVRILLRDRHREVAVTHWAWERGPVLRVESRVDIATPARAPGGGAAATISFRNPDFDLAVASITAA